jgi:nucleotidyltransferase substrate binding protein (TIGR01987 family)
MEMSKYHLMTKPMIDLSVLRKALSQLEEALKFWHEQAQGSPLKRHLRSAVIQSFEFSYELSVRSLRRVLVERVASADLVVDLSFNDLLRKGADAGLVSDPMQWRRWRDMRNATSHTYDEERANEVAHGAELFYGDAQRLLVLMEKALEN